VHDAEDAGGHEPDQRNDRERYVDVEDLLNEALIDVVGGVEEDKRQGCPDRNRCADREPRQTPSEELWLQGFQSSITKSNNA
jgi:hypothetical protein